MRLYLLLKRLLLLMVLMLLFSNTRCSFLWKWCFEFFFFFLLPCLVPYQTALIGQFDALETNEGRMILRAAPNKQQADKWGGGAFQAKVALTAACRSRGAGGAAHADGRGGRQGLDNHAEPSPASPSRCRRLPAAKGGENRHGQRTRCRSGGPGRSRCPRSRPGYETAGEGPVPAAGSGGAGGAEAAGAQVRAGWSFRPGRGGAGPRQGLLERGRCLGKSLRGAC